MTASANRIGRGRGKKMWTVWAGTLVLAAWAAGCSDHRMSLTDFVDLQHELDAAKAAEANVQAAPPAQLDSHLGPYRVGPGDVLAVTLTGVDAETSFEPLAVRVDRNGRIDLPVVGEVHVADRELEDVEDAIRDACVPALMKHATVHATVTEPARTNVLVLGAVQLPGLVPLNRTQCDALHAIVLAGGLDAAYASGQATLCRVRHPEDQTTLDLTTPAGLRATLALPPLEPGDIVTVHAATPNTVFVGGLVNLPRAQIYPQGVRMTVLQALAGANGLRTDVTPRQATLIRRLPDGQDAHVKLNLDRITTGQDPNLLLAAGDILWVPHTAETRVQDWVNRNIFFRAGVTATAGVNYNAQAVEYLNGDAERGAGINRGNLQDQYDPFGFLLRNQALNSLSSQ